MITIHLDSTQIYKKEDLYENLNSFLHFPDYFGYNLDALHDWLEETNEPITLIIDQPKILEEHLGILFYQKFLQVFQDIGISITKIE